MIDIEAIKKQLAEISPWPWRVEETPAEYGKCLVDNNGERVPSFDADLPFIASAPETIAKLVEELELLAPVVQEVERLRKDYKIIATQLCHTIPLSEADKEIEHLRKQNKIIREALEFYSAQNLSGKETVFYDMGKRAQEALAAVEYIPDVKT
jgi:hypothetical protein